MPRKCPGHIAPKNQKPILEQLIFSMLYYSNKNLNEMQKKKEK